MVWNNNKKIIKMPIHVYNYILHYSIKLERFWYFRKGWVFLKYILSSFSKELISNKSYIFIHVNRVNT